jgi:hypothetical protein
VEFVVVGRIVLIPPLLVHKVDREKAECKRKVREKQRIT